MLKFLSLFLSLLMISATLSAQSHHAAEGPNVFVWVGAEVSTFNPDFGCLNASPFSCGSRQLIGITPFVDVDHLFFTRLGVEGEARFLRWHGPPNGLTESSYLAGPRFNVLRFKRRFYLNAKVLVGPAHLSVPSGGVGPGTYFAYAPGAVTEFRVTRRVSARVDYEYQIWPTFSGIRTAKTSGTGGLTPNGFSFGVAYALLR